MFLLTIILALNMSEQNCGFFVNDNSHQFYKNCSGFSHSKGTVMQCTFLEIKNIGTGCPILKCAFWKCSCMKTVNHVDRKWWFLKSQHNIFWYSCLTFAKKKKEMIKIFIWRKKIFCIINFFWNFLKKFFRSKSLFGLI